jgi:drug/metabolite transporter (DMT)-like permease
MNTNTMTGIIPWHREAYSGKALGWIALSVAILAGSTSVTFATALAGALSPLSMLFISEALTMLFTVLSFGLFPILRRISRLKRKHMLPILFVGLSNSVVAPLLAFTGLRMTGPINAELFMRAEDIFLILLAVAFLGERLKKQHIIGALCVLLGVAVVTLRGFSETITLSRGDTYIILASMLYACGGILYKKKLHKVEPELMIFCRTCVALSVFFLSAPFMHHTLLEELKHFPTELIVALLGYGFLARFVNLFSFYESIERLPVRTVSLLLNLGLIGSIAFAHVYLGAEILPFHLAGAGFILIGSVLMEIESITGRKMHFAALLKHKHRSHV